MFRRNIATQSDISKAININNADAAVLSVLSFLLHTDSAADWGPVIQRALDNSPVGATIYMPARNDGTAYDIRTGVVIQKTQGFISHAYFNIHGAITGFQISGTFASLIGVNLVGDNNLNGNGIVVIGPKVFVSNFSITSMDNGLVIAPGGFEQVIQSGSIRNCVSRYIWVQPAGIGPVLTGITCDTDNYNITGGPSIASLHLQAGGTTVNACDFLHGECLIEPNGISIEWNFFQQCYFDTNPKGAGIHITNSSSDLHIWGIYISDCWTSTCSRGILIDGTGLIDEIRISDHIAKNNGGEAIAILNGNEILIDNPSIIGSAQITKNAASIYTNTTGFVQITNGRVMGHGTGEITSPYAHVLIDQKSGGVLLDGTSFDNFVQTKVINNLAATKNIVFLGNVPGAALDGRGIASIEINTNSVIVTHGLSYPPNTSELIVWPTSQTGGDWWVNNITSTQFTINIGATKSTPTNFAWSASIRNM